MHIPNQEWACSAVAGKWQIVSVKLQTEAQSVLFETLAAARNGCYVKKA
jgi:hypothetical protein